MADGRPRIIRIVARERFRPARLVQRHGDKLHWFRRVQSGRHDSHEQSEEVLHHGDRGAACRLAVIIPANESGSD